MVEDHTAGAAGDPRGTQEAADSDENRQLAGLDPGTLHAASEAVRRLWTLLLLTAAACSTQIPVSTDVALSAELAEVPAVALHDVAILFPLPAPGDANGLWPATQDLGGARALLPAAVVDALGSMVAGEPNRDIYALLRVVSLRLEPCFVADAAAPTCERQIRFVLQPVAADRAGVARTTTLDAAVHVIYELPTSAFAALARGIVALRTASAPQLAAPLGVHPVLATEGLAGPFARGLLPLVVESTGKGRLTRITFMGVRGRGNEWQFGGVRVAADGTLAPLPIPSSGLALQSIVLQRGGQSFVKSVSPQTAGTDDVSLLFDSISASVATRTEISAALRAANRIENPVLRSSEDTDCATCHAVASSRFWAEKTFAMSESASRFAAKGFDLAATGAPTTDLGVLRALGYFGSDAAISPRAIHEAAQAAQTIREGSTARP